MKKIFIAMAALVCSMSVNAQTMKVMKGDEVVATYTAEQADKVVFEEATAPAGDPKLNIKVTSSDIATLKAIKVVTDQNIDGESKEKVLQIAEAQQTPADAGTVYSIEIPSQEYGFYQIYLSEDGTTYKEAMATKSNVGEITEDQNIDYEKNAVQLWADGPYLATENAGPMTWSEGMTAWGDAWTIVSETDLDNMFYWDFNKVTNTWAGENSVWGWKITGNTEGYTNNSILLPCKDGEEYSYGIRCCYWTSTSGRLMELWWEGYAYSNGLNSGVAFEYYVHHALR